MSLTSPSTLSLRSHLSQPSEYRPLIAPDEIRLLILRPGMRADLLHCVLQHTRLSQTSEYEALSYEWGTVEPAEWIRLGERDFQTSPNL